MNGKNNKGFTLIEIIISIAILSVLLTIVVSGFFSYQKISDLNNNTQEFVGIVKLAQNMTLSSTDNKQYGVYINTAVSPNQYVLFKGSGYTSRIPSADQNYSLQNTTEFYNINLGGDSQIVFDRLTGASEESGSVSIRIKADASKSKTVYVSGSGTIGFTPFSIPSDANRVKDSRHLQFSYSRVINNANEYITLTFDNSITKNIPINSYLVGDEFQWQGTVSVGGTSQIVEINTHRLNSPDTLFSISRDRRYNSKSLKVTISGDSSGYLAQYSADGSVTNYSSIYVSNFNLQ